MTALTLTADALTAARYVVAHTCLDNLPPVALRFDGDELTINPDWPWCSGERRTLLPLLDAIAAGDLNRGWGLVYDADVDEYTRQACVDALRILEGVAA